MDAVKFVDMNSTYTGTRLRKSAGSSSQRRGERSRNRDQRVEAQSGGSGDPEQRQVAFAYPHGVAAPGVHVDTRSKYR